MHTPSWGCKLFCICEMPMRLVERGCGKTFTLWNWFLCLRILLTSNYMGIWTNINLNLLIRLFGITNQNLKKGFWHFHLFQISQLQFVIICATISTSMANTFFPIEICHVFDRYKYFMFLTGQNAIALCISGAAIFNLHYIQANVNPSLYLT